MVEGEIIKIKNIHNCFLNLIDNENNTEENYRKLVNAIDDYVVKKDQYKLKSFINMVEKIANNHHRSPHFFNIRERVIHLVQGEIKSLLNNNRTYEIFQNNKRILLFLIEEKIVNINESILSKMTKSKYIKSNYIQYFSPEINKSGLKQCSGQTTKNFEEKRMVGENDNYICQLIRKDSINEFCTYIKEKKNTKKKNTIIFVNTFLS